MRVPCTLLLTRTAHTVRCLHALGAWRQDRGSGSESESSAFCARPPTAKHSTQPAADTVMCQSHPNPYLRVKLLQGGQAVDVKKLCRGRRGQRHLPRRCCEIACAGGVLLLRRHAAAAAVCWCFVLCWSQETLRCCCCCCTQGCLWPSARERAKAANQLLSWQIAPPDRTHVSRDTAVVNNQRKGSMVSDCDRARGCAESTHRPKCDRILAWRKDSRGAQSGDHNDDLRDAISNGECRGASKN